jgi:exodeoxyribonuclease VII large subunit
LLALSPATTLSRGYAIVQRPDGSVVRAAAEVQHGERLALRFADGQLTAVAEDQ